MEVSPPRPPACPLKLSSHLCKPVLAPPAPTAVVKGRVSLWFIALKSDRVLEGPGQGI